MFVLEMKVMLYFQCDKDTSDTSLQHIMYGKYLRAGFVFVTDDNITTWFGPREGTLFCQANKNFELGTLLSLDILKLPVKDEDVEKLYKTCEACAQSKIPFNFMDLYLIHLPFREIEDIPLFKTKSLNNAQAIILILRECLESEHPLRVAVAGLHSRKTFMGTLYDSIHPFTLPVLSSSLMRREG